MRFQVTRPSLSGETGRVLADLNRDGIAITSVERLLGANSSFAAIREATRNREEEMSPELAILRRHAQAAGASGVGEKNYLMKLLGECPKLDHFWPFAKFAIEEPVLRIVNEYYHMYTRLRAFNVWHNVARSAPAESAQLWHRDLDELHYVVKVFVTLCDVDDGNGPFTYAKGTHRKGRYTSQPEYLFMDGATGRSNDDQMAAVVPRSEWLKCTGPAGTIIFADTGGYHKGGHATERDRIVYVSMYGSPKKMLPAAEQFQRTMPQYPPLSSAQELALKK